jgi:hypothetical protein
MEEFRDNAVGLELDMPKANVWKGAYYGNMHLPHPTNEAAKMVDGARIMREVMDAK